MATQFHVVLRQFSSSKAALNTIVVGNWTNQKRVRSLGDRRHHLLLPGQLYKSHAVYRICIICLTMAPQANAALKMAVLHLRKSEITAKSVCQQTRVCERTQEKLDRCCQEGWDLGGTCFSCSKEAEVRPWLWEEGDWSHGLCHQEEAFLQPQALYEAQGGATKY